MTRDVDFRELAVRLNSLPSLDNFMKTPARAELLRTVCALLPAPERTRIVLMHPDDYVTFVEAYSAVRHLPDLDTDLVRQLVNTIYELMEVETEDAVERRLRLVPSQRDGYQRSVLKVLPRPERDAARAE